MAGFCDSVWDLWLGRLAGGGKTVRVLYLGSRTGDVGSGCLDFSVISSESGTWLPSPSSSGNLVPLVLD